LNLKIIQHSLSDKDLIGEEVEPVLQVLRTNTCVTLVDLRKNHLGSKGAACIASALNDCSFFKLYLGSNEFGPEGVKSIADALTLNRTLTEVQLHENKMGAQGAKYIAGAFKSNNTLTECGLFENEIGALGAEYIADALLVNSTLIRVS